MLERFRAERSYAVTTNLEGDVVKIRMVGEFLQKSNLCLLADLKSLESVVLMAGKDLTINTNDIEVLTAIPKLTSVELRCLANCRPECLLNFVRIAALRCLR